MKKLAVLLPTYNAASYLEESIDSILYQTFSDFDLYVYDDCSTDNTAEIVSKYTDFRVFYKRNNVNMGISKTLNKGLEDLLLHYEYIARMDADDWSYPERFKKQLGYLEQNKEVVLCGTQGYWLKDMSQNPNSGWKYPLNNQYLQRYLLFGASFGHSSVMIRSHFFNQYNLRYSETIATCEDWELWMRVLQFGVACNLPDFLMKYRVLENSNHRSLEKQQQHWLERSKIISNYWSNFGIELSPKQVFDFYYNENEIYKTEFINNCKVFIRAFNKLNEKSSVDLEESEKSSLAYMLARKILNYWRRSGVSRINVIIWVELVSEVRFMSKTKWIKSIIR
ncbi:glycosyltransferase family A protein [Flavobacterium ovatum]|uniref:glycosyltransferase family 2 protein n=1 Tax=Flavobacterium ovatum TaxID=1928857 RepID=UPI00344BC8FB